MKSIEHAYRTFATERFPLPSEADICALEQRIAVNLPEDYREYILQYNGGAFSEPEFELEGGSLTDLLDEMHGIGATFPGAELASPADLLLFDSNDPLGCLPIGSTSMGNLVVLLTLGEDRGAILFKKAWGGFQFLAKGIDEFFGLLRPADDE